MGNSICVSVCNTYNDSLSSLPGVALDNIKISSLFGDNCFRLTNLSRNSLISAFKLFKEPIPKIENVVICLSGHGVFDSANNCEVFDCAEDSTIYLSEIVKYFKEYHKIFIIMDSCQNRSPKKMMFSNKFPKGPEIIICCPVAKDKSALCSNKTGSFFISSIFDVAKDLTLDKLSTEIFIKLMEVSFMLYIKKYGLIPKIYADKLVRDEYEIQINTIANITKQSQYSVMATRINNHEIDTKLNKINELISIVEKKITKTNSFEDIYKLRVIEIELLELKLKFLEKKRIIY
ncbi:caspase domain protein [Tupanvirus soda lake]|uniref:Caspase domain protein n=2 Tax=Tupanvirus TaxID=2094720 RepID=A0A6N1NNW8_9VIRU|nr:caspase domain protein [Tupanvirus soda lake]QKU35945.1 caspase domain protein [Tupanvirus soda lake]